MNAAAGDEEVGEEFSRTLLKGLLQRELGKVQISIQKVEIPPSSHCLTLYKIVQLVM